ncbi:MAG: hypothetical protein KAS70_05640 [Planctomycetes bacterium]|nr:hypothetical protein [Planctomycetota bacterium]
MKTLSLILSLLPLPGLGQIIMGRYFRGTVFFLSFVILVDLAFIIFPTLWGPAEARQLSNLLILIALFIWAYNIFDIIRIVYWRERASLQERKKDLFREGLTLYLRNDLHEARKIFSRILKLDRDDPDAIFYLGVIARYLDQPRRAARLFQRCLSLDETEKWRWEINEHLKKT